MLRDDVRRTDGQTKDDALDWQPELGRLKRGVVRKHVRLYHERHVDVLCAQLPCKDMYRISERSAYVDTEHVRAYAFEPSNPCSSPANATSSTLVWNVRPSSLMRWAIASREMVPEPSSLAPGAYELAVSVIRRSQQSVHSHVVSQTIHASHNDRRSTPSTAGPPCQRIY